MDQIRSMWSSGVITGDTLFWSEKEQEWRPVPELLTPKWTTSPASPPEKISSGQPPTYSQPVQESRPSPATTLGIGTEHAAQNCSLEQEEQVIESHCSTDSVRESEDQNNTLITEPVGRKIPEVKMVTQARTEMLESHSTLPTNDTPSSSAWDPEKQRPWRRLLARFLDLQILGGIPASIIAPILLYFFRLPAGVTVVAVLYAFAIGLESWLLTRYGFTPAKWLLGISVRESNGEKLSSIHATKRAQATFWRCFFLNLPFTGLLAYRDLMKRGATKWDRKNSFRVTYSKLNGGQWFSAISLAALFILSFVVVVYEILVLLK